MAFNCNNCGKHARPCPACDMCTLCCDRYGCQIDIEEDASTSGRYTTEAHCVQQGATTSTARAPFTPEPATPPARRREPAGMSRSHDFVTASDLIELLRPFAWLRGVASYWIEATDANPDSDTKTVLLLLTVMKSKEELGNA